jgi:hypothetical protein
VSSDSILRVHLPGFLLLFTLLIAVGFYLIRPPERVTRTLFFPGTTATELSGERRLVPRTGDRERAIELLVQEVLLGPAKIKHSRALPRATRIDSLILSDDVVYVDLNEAAMLESPEVRVDVETGLRALRETVLYNDRSLDDVVITIAGNVPFVPAFRAVGR